MVDKNKNTWPNKLPKIVWAYRIMIRTTTQATPYYLVVGGEVVLPLEICLLSLRVAIYEEMTNEENANVRLAELEALHEDKLSHNTILNYIVKECLTD